jgi:hypothetical protein
LAKRRSRKRSFAEIDRGPLGSAVFDARKRAGLTQAQLAVAIGRDRPWVSDLETAKITFVSGDDARGLAERLQFSRTELALLHSRTGASRRRSAAWRLPVGACPACGSPREHGALYCGACGFSLPPEVKCPVCAHVNLSGAAFCTRCGDQLHASPV